MGTVLDSAIETLATYTYLKINDALILAILISSYKITKICNLYVVTGPAKINHLVAQKKPIF